LLNLHAVSQNSLQAFVDPHLDLDLALHCLRACKT